MRGVLVLSTPSEFSMYDLNVFIEPQILPLLHDRCFGLLLICEAYGNFNIQLCTIVFAWFHWIYLLYYWGDISYGAICLCVVNHSLQIYLPYSKICWVFHPLCLEGFPMVDWFIWLIYVVDLFMRFIYAVID